MAKRKRPSAIGRTAKRQKHMAMAAGVGAAIGAAAALLFAPSSGKKLRKDLKREGKKAGVILAKQKTAIEHELHAVVEALPPNARRTLNLAKSKLTKAIVSSKGALTSGRYRDMVDDALKTFDGESEAVRESLEQAKKQWNRAFTRIKKHLK